MTVLDMFRGVREVTTDPRMQEQIQDLETYLTGERETNVLLKERLLELELALDEEGWLRMGFEGAREFSRDGLRKIIDMSRLMTLKNPIIQRAVEIRAFYVWGQSVQIQARASDVNEVVQDFMDDVGNRRELFSHSSRILKDKKLAHDGNIFFVLDTDYVTGKVNLRSIPTDEVEDIIINPDDKNEFWYYVRKYEQKSFDKKTGRMTSKAKKAYYPDYYYALQRQNDKTRPSKIGDAPVLWSQPVLHMKHGGLDDMRFGVPEVYSSLDWARAYKSYLEDWASLVRALAIFAWKYSTKKNKLSTAREKMESMTDPEGKKQPAGSIFLKGGEGDLVPINKSGAQTSAEDGRMLRLMVASGMHVPDTMLSNDPQQGALATAKTLDRPTELAMKDRQTLWADTIREIVRYVLIQSVSAPFPKLNGDYTDGKLTINSTDEETSKPETIDVIFPPIVIPDLKDQIESIISAMTLNGKTVSIEMAPTRVFRELILNAFGVEDMDEILENMDTDDETAPTVVAQAEESLKYFIETLTEAASGNN